MPTPETTDDMIERLCTMAKHLPEQSSIFLEAAGELARLRDENAKLRKLLVNIDSMVTPVLTEVLA